MGLGAGVGLADKYLEDLADKRKYRKILSGYKEKLSAIVVPKQLAKLPTQASKAAPAKALKGAQGVGKPQNRSGQGTVIPGSFWPRR